MEAFPSWNLTRITRRPRRWWASSALVLLATLVLGHQSMGYGHNATLSSVPSTRFEVHSVTFFSQDLQREMPYITFLPPGYGAGSERYPVLYMLHGLSGTDAEWTWYGIFDTADRMMRDGSIPRFIIVLPQGDDSYWVDHDGGPAWGKYLAFDVVRDVDTRYRTIPEARARALAGLSMGADGSLQAAINFPQQFGTAVANSPVLRPYELASTFYGDLGYFDEHYPVTLVQHYPDVARGLNIEIDVGSADPWFDNALEFHQELDALGIAHEWHVWPGTHDAAYWTARVPDDLRFVGDAFETDR